jgi:hypothetical protein
MSQPISLNKSVLWGIKTFFEHWQLALITIAIQTVIFLLFKDTVSSPIISIEPTEAFTSLEEIHALAMQPQHNYLLKLMMLMLNIIANLIFIPCALALYQRGSASVKDIVPSLPVVVRYIFFIIGYVCVAAIAILCFQGAYYIFSMRDILYKNFNVLNSIVAYIAIGFIIPALCLAGAYLVARYYLAYFVIFHEKVGLIASFKRAAQLAQNNWLALAVIFAIEGILMNSPLYFISILIAVHAYGAARGTDPYQQM